MDEKGKEAAEEEEEEEEEEEAEAEAAVVGAFVRKEVADWDDEGKSRARFKALSGQRSDWEPLYRFWRELILKVARHLHIFIIRPSRLNRLWFRRHGLSPLCLDRVLVEMHRAGDILPMPMQHQPNSRLSYILSRALPFWGLGPTNDALTQDSYYILAPLLQEQALEVVKKLSEDYWTTSCVITMKKFRHICLGSRRALAILDYLSVHGRAKLLTISKGYPMQGVKVCLAPGAVSSASSMDYSVLHLVSTAEMLEQQLDLIHQRYQKSRNSALASLKSGDRRVALRYAKELKLGSQSRERCMTLLDRVEKVLQVIMDAESSKKVSEAIQSSSRVIKENQITVEEVELCLQEVDESIDSLKRLDTALDSSRGYAEIDDEDMEDEFAQLQLEIKRDQVRTETGLDSSAGGAEISEKPDALSNIMSNLTLRDDESGGAVAECCINPVGNKSMSKERSLEPA